MKKLCVIYCNCNGCYFRFLSVCMAHNDCSSCVCSSFLTDNMPEELPVINDDGINDPNDLVLDISWTPLQEGEGRKYLRNYIVSIDVEDLSSTSRRKRQDNSFSVPPDTSTYTYDEARPYFRYRVQVLADLDVNGMPDLRPVTGVIEVITPESGESKRVSRALRGLINWRTFNPSLC